jgi:hypothetical protein
MCWAPRVGAIMIGFGPRVYVYSANHGIHLENSYTAVAGIFAIIAGFLAAFYGSVQALADSRLKRIAKTSTFARFIHYIKEATIAGFILSVISIPLIVWAPTEIKTGIDRLALGIWCGLSAYALLAFFRVGRNLFFVFEHEPPQDDGAI